LKHAILTFNTGQDSGICGEGTTSRIRVADHGTLSGLAETTRSRIISTIVFEMIHAHCMGASHHRREENNSQTLDNFHLEKLVIVCLAWRRKLNLKRMITRSNNYDHSFASFTFVFAAKSLRSSLIPVFFSGFKPRRSCRFCDRGSQE